LGTIISFHGRNPLPGDTAILLDFFENTLVDFNATLITGYAPLAVFFQNLSVSPIDEWEWSFGDGSISHERDPIHVFKKSGIYSVRLTNGYSQSYYEFAVKEGFIAALSRNKTSLLKVLPYDGEYYLELSGIADSNQMQGFCFEESTIGHSSFLKSIFP
jgi:hypothetical protein